MTDSINYDIPKDGLLEEVIRLRGEVSALQLLLQRYENLELKQQNLEKKVQELTARLQISKPGMKIHTEEDKIRAKQYSGDALAVKISDCDFSDQVALRLNRLFRDRSTNPTLGDVCAYKMSEILKLRAFGPMSANNLNYVLGKYGLTMAEEDNQRVRKRVKRLLLPSQAKLTKLTDLGLSGETLAELQSQGFETVGDVILIRGSYRWLRDKTDVYARFKNQGNAEEFLEKIKEFGFLLK